MTKSKDTLAYVCINCGQKVKELYKKYSNTFKTVNCEKCHNVADKYIEFETVIILVDSMLLSQQAYRHALFNRDFKLFWKLSLMLLLLESFTLWREKREHTNDDLTQSILVNEHGFYLCCAQNICDYLLTTFLLLLASMALRKNMVLNMGLKSFGFVLLKANVLANFSKFFLLPIMLWRENTTDFGAAIHRTLVTGHHLCSLIFVYVVVTRLRVLQAALIVLPVYIIKEFIMQNLSLYMEEQFS
ncbi:protein ARV1 [Calliphora vicina]|uniref:protein ARV1 n=1 Tax=Calliphora vicina TaxID=7373 RepID=UPI00325C1BAC